MRLLKVILLIILFSVNPVLATTNEYDLEEIYNSSLKIVSDTPVEVQENTNYLLLDKDNFKVISVDKDNINLYPSYMHIGYDVNGSFIINSINDSYIGDILFENDFNELIDDIVEMPRNVNEYHTRNFEDRLTIWLPIIIVYLLIASLIGYILYQISK